MIKRYNKNYIVPATCECGGGQTLLELRQATLTATHLYGSEVSNYFIETQKQVRNLRLEVEQTSHSVDKHQENLLRLGC